MKVTKKLMPDGYHSWIVIDQIKQVIEPVERYLDYLYHLQKSPNTLRAYAYHLMHYWQYLSSKRSSPYSAVNFS
jgi:integrase/recombinase XerD